MFMCNFYMALTDHYDIVLQCLMSLTTFHEPLMHCKPFWNQLSPRIDWHNIKH